MGAQENRRIFPIIVVAVGLLFLAGAVVSFLLLKSQDQQSMGEATSTLMQEPQVTRLSLIQAKGAFDAGSAVFVDVRDKESYETGHIPGAMSIPLREIEERMNELNPNDWLILY